MAEYDFSGWATRFDVLCSDGRTIRKNAFNDCDGTRVPLVWNHSHDDPEQVLGHADLICLDEGVYCYGAFNDTFKGQEAKKLVQHGDISSLSIYANHLKQSSNKPPCDVYHGMIREVSLVLSGANIGAKIDNVTLSHSDDGEEELEGTIYVGDDNSALIIHSDEDDIYDEETEEMTYEEILETLDDDQAEAVEALCDELIDTILDDDDDEFDEDDYDDGFDEDDYDDDAEHSDIYGGNMKYNVFDGGEVYDDVITHADMEDILSEAKRLGSLRAAVEENIENGGVLAHTDATYGIQDIDYLFPDARNYTDRPEFIQRNMDWVAKVMSETHHTPFSRVKSMFADITADEARAKGYIKGNLKKEEVFSLLKRSTDPQTIYKKQKLDKDDITDITSFDVVAWVRSEMRMMLEEEIARAILIGDGRLSSDDDKISEDHIRPVYNDSALYTVKCPIKVANGANAAAKAKAFIDEVIRQRKEYKGSGNPTLWTTEDMLVEMLLLEDGIGHKLYKSASELATTLRVKEIVTVEPMENLKINISNKDHPVAGVLVNLKDYNVGADKGGKTDLFDDFDIDYNQYKYLLETRMSGALVKPYSAETFYIDEESI